MEPAMLGAVEVGAEVLICPSGVYAVVEYCGLPVEFKLLDVSCREPCVGEK